MADVVTGILGIGKVIEAEEIRWVPSVDIGVNGKEADSDANVRYASVSKALHTKEGICTD